MTIIVYFIIAAIDLAIDFIVYKFLIKHYASAESVLALLAVVFLLSVIV